MDALDRFIQMALSDDPAWGPPVTPPVERDSLVAARDIQTALGEAYAAREQAPVLTGERVFAGRIERDAVASPSAYYPAGPYEAPTVSDLLGLDEPAPDWTPDPDPDPFADPSGVSRDPELGLFDDGLPVPVLDDLPPTYLADPEANPQVQGAGDLFPPSVMEGLADALGPDISSVSRLGGPFAGYTTDQLTTRLRELVRRA